MNCYLESMKILGIDTSSKYLALGVLDGTSVCEYNLELGTRLSGSLVVTIKRVLDALGYRPCDIDYFACGLGPGSFTGLRVGLAAIKGFSWSVNKPIAAIPSADILARNFDKPQGIAVVAVDAKRGLLYTSIYRMQDGCLKRIAPFMLLTPQELLRKINKTVSKAFDIYLLGDGAQLCRQENHGRLNLKILDKDYWYPQGRHIISLAAKAIKGKNLKNPFRLDPIYLYPKECQIRK